MLQRNFTKKDVEKYLGYEISDSSFLILEIKIENYFLYSKVTVFFDTCRFVSHDGLPRDFYYLGSVKCERNLN